MQLSQLRHSDIIAIRAPAGRLDATTVAAFRQAVIALLTSRIVRIVVDCREITFIDSAGLGAIAGAASLASLWRGEVQLAAPRPQVLGLLMGRRALAAPAFKHEARG
ncbi:MAG TPA: STAS domain-containing protein [Myxococcales bacterium]|nr:STAS domain-containing protein [Myxococcales bacterium]